MEASRSEIRRETMMIGIFRMSIEQGSSVVNQVPTAYAANPTLHNMEMKVKFVSGRGYNYGLRRELVGCFWEFSGKCMEGSSEKSPSAHTLTEC